MFNHKELSESDRILVGRVLSGDTSAFSLIIKNTEGLVAQISFKMIQRAEDRKDVVQDIYLKAYQNLSGFKFQSKLSTWLGQIAFNTCLNYLTKKKLVFLENYDKEIDDETPLSKIQSEEIDIWNNEVEEEFAKKQLSGILKKEIERLPPIYKTLITLYHNEEMNYAEIAQIISLPEGTVKNYLFRARRKLKINLHANFKNEIL